MVGCKLIEKERNASENHREQIVEFVGNTAREMPDRLHLLCLRELGLGVREIVVGALQVPIEAGIVQGDRSLRGERLREPGVVRVIDPPVASATTSAPRMRSCNRSGTA